MREIADTTRRFPVLDELGAEFLRVARADSLPRRRLRLRRVVLAMAVALIVVPAGFAVAEEGESDSGAPNDSAVRPTPEDFLNSPLLSARIKSLLNEPAIAERLEAMGYKAVDSMGPDDFAKLDAATFLANLNTATDDYRNYLQEHPAEVKDVNVIDGELAPILTQECRANPNADNLCGVALAADDGKLPSGRYTDAELQAAVRAAGYDWIPSD
jgi:hypothetical protein